MKDYILTVVLISGYKMKFCLTSDCKSSTELLRKLSNTGNSWIVNEGDHSSFKIKYNEIAMISVEES